MNSLNTHPEILQLELLTLATSPAVHEELHDGWVLRASGTDTRRANSVTQLEPGALSLAQKIAYCEEWYFRHEQVPTFRLTSALSPPALDRLLEEREYDIVTPSHVMTTRLAPPATSPVPEPSAANIRKRTLAEGIGDLHALKGSDAALAARDIARQQAWSEPECNLAWFEADEPVACGMARVSGTWAGVFNMRTAPAWRGRGLGGRLVQALLQWAAGQGATQAFLQVEQGNAPALALYRRHGFSVRYDYHYRVRNSE
jgi:GNAT superfamily N-acetyltransferase